MSMKEIVEVVITSNERYGEMLGKSINFEVNIIGQHPNYHTFMILSLINNLVSNAVEAIQDQGIIEINVTRLLESVEIKVKDNGLGISIRNRALVFEPGFTTKFNEIGIASNGIGLSYVKNVIENLGGEITLLEASDTTFEILLPIESLMQKG
jgi:two-component system sensor histidine kinase YcbA